MKKESNIALIEAIKEGIESEIAADFNSEKHLELLKAKKQHVKIVHIHNL